MTSGQQYDLIMGNDIVLLHTALHVVSLFRYEP